MASPRDAAAKPPDGIPVVFPALEQETPRYPNGPPDRDGPVDLVVLGTSREIGKDESDPLFEITIEKVLFGSCSLKTVAVKNYVSDKGRRIFGLARSLYKSEGDEYVHRYGLPATEEKAQIAFGKARLDYYALSAAWIFVGNESKANGRERNVRVTQVLRGDGLKPGQDVRVDLMCGGAEDPLTRTEPMIYFCSGKDRHNSDYEVAIRLPEQMEPAVREAMARKDSYPVMTIKDDGKAKKFRRILFTGTTDEAIALLASEHEATVMFVGQSLIHQGKEVRDRLSQEILQRMFTQDPGEADERIQENLCRVMAVIDRKGLSSILGEWLATLEAAGTTKDSTNRSLQHLLAVLDDGLWLARQHGKRLLELPDKLGPKQQAVVKTALAEVQLADRVELAAAVDRSRDLPVVRTKQPPKPSTKPHKPSRSEILDSFFRPAERATILFTPDPSLLRTVTQDGVLHIRDSATLKIKSEIKLPRNYAFVSAQPPHGKLALIAKVIKREDNGMADEYGDMRVIEFDTGKLVADIPLAVHWRYTNTHEFWLPNHELLILDHGKWHKVKISASNPSIETVELHIDKENELYNGAGYLTEDGKSLLILDGGGKSSSMEVKLCDVENRAMRTIGEIRLPYGCWSNDRGLVPGGENFFFGSPGLYIYDRTTLKPVIEPLFPKDDVFAITFSADGSKMAVATGQRGFVDRNLHLHEGGAQTMIRVHDLTTGKTLHAFPSPAKWVHIMTISPDGKRLVLLRDDSVIESYSLP